MMNKTFDEWGETEFNEWISKMYWEWYFCVWEPLEAAIEKSERTEGENE